MGDTSRGDGGKPRAVDSLSLWLVKTWLDPTGGHWPAGEIKYLHNQLHDHGSSMSTGGLLGELRDVDVGGFSWLVQIVPLRPQLESLWVPRGCKLWQVWGFMRFYQMRRMWCGSVEVFWHSHKGLRWERNLVAFYLIDWWDCLRLMALCVVIGFYGNGLAP